MASQALKVSFRHYVGDEILANIELTSLPRENETVTIDSVRYRVFGTEWFIFNNSVSVTADVVVRLCPWK